MILGDEGLNGNLVRSLREDGYEVTWIRETNAGMKDEDIIALARERSQVIITEDKFWGMDFCPSDQRINGRFSEI